MIKRCAPARRQQMWGPCSESTLEHTPNRASLTVPPCNREGMQGAVVLWRSIPRLYTRESSPPILGVFLVLEGNLTSWKLGGQRVHPANRSRREPAVAGLPIRATCLRHVLHHDRAEGGGLLRMRVQYPRSTDRGSIAYGKDSFRKARRFPSFERRPS